MSIRFWPPQLTGGNQLAIYERRRGFELGRGNREQIKSEVAGAGLEPRTARSDHSAALLPPEQIRS